MAHTASSKGVRGRQGVNPVSGGHIGGPVGVEVSAVVALPSPKVEVGLGVGVTKLRARGGGGRGGWVQGGASSAPTIPLVARCTVGREPERAG